MAILAAAAPEPLPPVSLPLPPALLSPLTLFNGARAQQMRTVGGFLVLTALYLLVNIDLNAN